MDQMFAQYHFARGLLPDAQRVKIRCEAEPVLDFWDLLTSHEPDDPVPIRHKNVLRNFLARFCGITTRKILGQGGRELNPKRLRISNCGATGNHSNAAADLLSPHITIHPVEVLE